MNSTRIYCAVDLDAIRFNIRNIKAKIGEDVKLMVVVKTDGYGHGVPAVARALAGEGVHSFGVATVDEAVELRNLGIDNPILILGYVFPNDLQDVINFDITSTVFSVESAKFLSDFAKKCGKTARVHIKIDTGMGRIGFIPSPDSILEIKEIFNMPNLSIEGIFTHFATADEAEKSAARKQARIFADFIKQLEADGMKFMYKHICNSAGIVDLPDCYFNMVRCGIITYGLYPSKEVSKTEIEIKPALALKSHVAYVKEVDAGFKVSYGSTYTTTGKTKIATIPVGYGDGYPRALSNKGRVLINGEYAPIIGLVCMDQFMVDVTGIDNVKPGVSVTLIGAQGKNSISVEEVADIAGTINYEIICGINKRVPRIY
ncbi:MAG: alanine racemase [Ruminococcaceae bacterium]|nr:alanine racemase [Oscillospiraceae bacterium]